MIVRIIAFLIMNFGALAIGSIFTRKGVPSMWYSSLEKAPWTPPGWVFGAAWSLIMICFAFYMAFLWREEQNRKRLIGLFLLQWCLNISWNPTFFYFHNVGVSLLLIIMLTLLVGYFLFRYWQALQFKVMLIVPYFVWLLVATSLNGYIIFKN